MGNYNIAQLIEETDLIKKDIQDAVKAIREKGGQADTYATAELANQIRTIPFVPGSRTFINENGTYQVGEFEFVEINVAGTWPSVDNTVWSGYGQNPADPSVYVSIQLQFHKDTHTVEYFILNEETGLYELQSETPYTQNGDTINTMYGSWTLIMDRMYNNEFQKMGMCIKEYPGMSIEYDYNIN